MNTSKKPSKKKRSRRDAIPFFQINPFPTAEQVEIIAGELELTTRTIYRAYQEYREAHPEFYGKAAGPIPKGKGVESVLETVKREELEKAVGAKPEDSEDGDQGEEEYIIIPRGVGFVKFCAKFSYPFYSGLFNWQIECFEELWLSDSRFLKINVPRDHGKSVLLTELFEWLMDPLGGDGSWDILYLGWTDKRLEVAEDVYKYFEMRGLLHVDKHTSEFHFRLKSGAKFDTYLTTAKATLGLHSVGKFGRVIDEENKVLKKYIRDTSSGRKLLICIDDPIDSSFMDERHKEKKLERKFQSTIYNINPDRFLFVGTKKFEGDIFDFWDKTFGEKLLSYVRGPFMEPDDPRFHVESLENPLGILCMERFTHPDHPCYASDLACGKRDLDEIRRDIGEYWWSAEYCQNPHPVTGEVFKELVFVDVMESWTAYDVLVISIDRATTEHPTSSYTGFVAEVREREGGRRLVLHDFTGYWSFEELMEKVNEFICEFHKRFMNIGIYLVLEKQGGGDDFYSSARGRGAEFLNCCVVVLVHNTQKKLPRIKDYLYSPIVNGGLRFLASLRNSELVKEILEYPHGSRVDGMDALANGEHEIDIAERIPPVRVIDVASLEEVVAEMHYYVGSGRLRELDGSRGDEFGVLAKNTEWRVP